MGRPRHWIKLWVSWLDSKAHLELSEGAFGLGPLLLLLASWDGEYESGGWLLNQAGAPMSRDALARATHRTVARLDSQLAELVACETLSTREDGALGFANYGHWQETAQAKRTRNYRHKSRHSDGGSNASGDGGCDAQTEDGRRQSSSLRSEPPVVPAGDECPNPPILALAPPPSDPPKAKKGGKAKPRTDYPEGLAEHFLVELQAACATMGRHGPRKLTDHHRDDLRKLYAAHEPTPEEISHVVAVRRAMDARGEGYGFLTWESICVPGNFARWLATPIDAAPPKAKRDEDAPFGRRPSTGKPYLSAQDREEWQRVDAANARRTEALRGGR